MKLEDDTDDIPGIDTEVDLDTPPAVKDEKVITCSLKTTTFRLKKQTPKKRLRSYRCPTCKEQFRRLALLNDHYKNTHSPILCEDCTNEFCTPSALERHAYLHKLLDYTCTICDKQFPFASDLEQHKISHVKVKTHHCTQENCDRSLFNKGDLSKHMLTHSSKSWKCQLCDYTSKDKPNLKSHMHVHSNLKRYICVTHSRLFKYHKQLSRHLPCKTSCVKLESKAKIEVQTLPQGSRSPEY